MVSFSILASAVACVAATRSNNLGRKHLDAGQFTAPEDALAFTGLQHAFEMFELHAPTQAAAGAKAPAAGGDKTTQPVGVQVDEKVMDNLKKELSPACGKRYGAMMKGEGPEMHNFNEHAKDGKGDQCEKDLQGSKCNTLARITESKAVPDGRKMTAHTKVEGVSCLPKECTSDKDLTVLAQFMHSQTKEIFPDEAIKVNLHVDCSGSGGAIVDEDGNPDTPAQPKPAQRSGASALFSMGTVSLLLVSTLA